MKIKNFLNISSSTIAMVAGVSLMSYFVISTDSEFKQNVDREIFNKAGHSLIQSDHDFMKNEMERALSTKDGLDVMDYRDTLMAKQMAGGVNEQIKEAEKEGVFDNAQKFQKSMNDVTESNWKAKSISDVKSKISTLRFSESKSPVIKIKLD